MAIFGVRHLPCGEFINASERIAVDRLSKILQSRGENWILLSNLNHSQHANFRSDEIDIVAIGANGVHVIEVKHWDLAYLKRQSMVVEGEAERINSKAKRIAGKLRRKLDPGFVTARLLLTNGEIKFEATKRPIFRGVSVFGLPECADLVSVNSATQLTPEHIELAARLLEPAAKIALSGEVRQFAGLINLERASDKSDAFHRVFRGQHSTRRDRVILHLYDLSATQEKQALELAKREFEIIQRWQKSSFVPSLLDSFQEADSYPGELYFYSMVDPAAPSIKERRKDVEWDIAARIQFCRQAIEALAAFHTPDDPSLVPIIHRRITPESVRVRHNGQPLFTDFSLSRLESAQTISMASVDLGEWVEYMAPEVQVSGLAAADTRSDVYALCMTLLTLFDRQDELGSQLCGIFDGGCSQNPEGRATLSELRVQICSFEEHGHLVTAAPALPAPDYWDEDTVVPFKESRYKIVGRLGQGGIGQTFKVVELDAHSDEKFGTYVAKVVRHKEDGDAAVDAYRRVRAYTTHPNLSTIHEIASMWEPQRFVALMKWVEGVPLQDLSGVLTLYAEDLGDLSAEQLALRWLIELCGALEELHRVGLVHGDVSLNNIIVQGGSVTLTDYDTVTNVGKRPRGGTLPYSSPSVQSRMDIQPVDDVFALAASFFHVLTDRDPFTYGSERRKDRGLNWDGVMDIETLRGFLSRATSPNQNERFSDASTARQFLLGLVNNQNSTVPVESPAPILTPNTVSWLHNLLTAYPGSRYGNSETRGLDSDFASGTYVKTKLDDVLLGEILCGKAHLVILFGNAGDGKTAFLQHLVKSLGVSDVHSSRRVWNLELENGNQLTVNLDGSAAWQGKSANELLNELFMPFHQPDYPRDRVHIVAINSGKLLEWIESQPEDTYLTGQLREVLMGSNSKLDQGFRLIDLNQRSLVGGFDVNKREVSTHFFEALLNRFIDGEGADPWKPCITCSAQNRCTAWYSIKELRDAENGRLLRRRLIDALQACHQRGEIHITARELRAALSYIFFGTHDCNELHENPDLRPSFYWKRAFDANSPHRQGELLAELTKFDPALEAHPLLDRALLRSTGYGNGGLADARRRAWFTHPNSDDSPVIRLANGRHFNRFRDVPLLNQEELEVLKKELCQGVARLEDLPNLALNGEHMELGVPLRATTRTPTETALWVLKPWERFSVKVPSSHGADGLEELHTHLQLVYEYQDGNEEVLILGLELFSVLMELKDGVQLSGIAQEGVFANLEIFTQRLAREDARELYSWHPAESGSVLRLRIDQRESSQVLLREPI